MLKEQIIPQFATKLMDKFSTGIKNKISRADFPNAINFIAKLIHAKVCSKDDLFTLFDIADQNGDQYISFNELLILLETLINVSSAEDRGAFKKIAKYVQ